MIVVDHTTNTAHKYTEAEFNMYILRCIAENHNLAPEELNAVEYSISCIKTLKDMEIIK